MSIQQNIASNIYRMADRVRTAKDIAALQQSLTRQIQSGAIESYIGVPIVGKLTQKLKEAQAREAMAMASPQQQQGQQGQQQQRPIADEVMDQAYEMSGGVDQLPSNLPIQNEEDDENYAGGGIIAFAEPTAQNNNSRVTDPDRRSPTDRGIDELIARINSSANNNVVIPPAANTGIAGVAPEVFSVDGVSPEFGGSSITADQDAERVAKIQAERTAAEDAQRQAFLRTAAPQMVRPEASAPERTVDTGMFSGVDSTGPDVMPPKAPSQGAVSPDVARQISATNPGAPATLKDAERQAASGSPQASAAVSMLDRYVAMLEKSGDDVGRQKKEALYMALIQGGLGMMGGTSPNAFANISAGLLPATQAYQQAIAGIRKDDRARLEKLLSAGLKKEEFLLKAQEIGINQQKADNWYEVMRERNAAMAGRGGGGDDNKKNTAYNLATNSYTNAVSKIDGAINRIRQDNALYLNYTGKNPEYLKKKQDIQTEINAQERRKENIYSQYRGFVTDRLNIDIPDFSGAAPKSNAPAVGTVQQGYKFKGGDPKDPKSWEKV